MAKTKESTEETKSLQQQFDELKDAFIELKTQFDNHRHDRVGQVELCDINSKPLKGETEEEQANG